MKLRSIVTGLTALGLGAALGAAPVNAQVWGAGADLRLGLSGAFESYSFQTPDEVGLKSISLLTTTFGAQVPLVGPANLGLVGRFARGELVRADESTATLSGLTDTELSLNVPVRRGSLVTTFSGIVLLPTGDASLTNDEADLAGIMASDFFPFRITYWGSGGGLGGSLGVVYGGARGSMGVSAGYVVARDFEPWEAGEGQQPFTYRPGNQLQVRAALDHNVGNAGKFTLALSLLRSDADLGNGVNLYQTGNRFQAMGSYSFALGGRSSGILYVGGTRREEGITMLEQGNDLQGRVTGGMPAQDLLLAGGGLRLRMGGGVLIPSVDARVFRRESGEGQGYLTGLGMAWEQPAGAVVLVPSVRGRVGRLVLMEGSESGLTGVDVGLSIRSARRAVR